MNFFWGPTRKNIGISRQSVNMWRGPLSNEKGKISFQPTDLRRIELIPKGPKKKKQKKNWPGEGFGEPRPPHKKKKQRGEMVDLFGKNKGSNGVNGRREPARGGSVQRSSPKRGGGRVEKKGMFGGLNPA